MSCSELHPQCPKPTFDLLMTNLNVFGVRGPLGGLSLLKSSGVWNDTVRAEMFTK